MGLIYGLIVGTLGFVLTWNGYPLVPTLIGTQALYWSAVITHNLLANK